MIQFCPHEEPLLDAILKQIQLILILTNLDTNILNKINSEIMLPPKYGLC
jgi:hypothetical protein